MCHTLLLLSPCQPGAQLQGYLLMLLYCQQGGCAIPLPPSLPWLRTHIVHQPTCVVAKHCTAPHGSSAAFFHESLPGTRAVCWLMARDEYLHSTQLAEASDEQDSRKQHAALDLARDPCIDWL